MKKINNLYKALELYELSPRDGKWKEYRGYTDSRNQYAVLAFIINTDSLKKNVINILLGYTNDPTITWKILSPSNSYIVGLFDLKSKSLIPGTLMFGGVKTILEDFNQKISTKRYEDYFKDNVSQTVLGLDTNFDLDIKTEESIDFWDIGEIVTKRESSTQEPAFERLTIEELRNNLQNSRTFLKSINNTTARDRIRKMWEITEAFETYRKELEKVNITDEVIDDILELSFGWALGLQERALDIKAEKMKLSNISRSAKKEREAVLQSV